jgi:hypothetical protein
MGIGFVLLFWVVLGGILSVGGAAVLRKAAESLTHGVVNGRRRAILTASAFPFVCFGWAVLIFIFQAVVNEGWLHRDVGIGDTWTCPLPNRYALLMIDVTDEGIVYNPKTQPGEGVGEEEDAVFGVRLVQIAGRYILGGGDSRTDDSYFLLDTQTGKRSNFGSYDELATAGKKLSIQLHLESIATVYRRYRFTWFDVLVGMLFCIPLLAYAVVTMRWIVRLRRTKLVAVQPAQSF